MRIKVGQIYQSTICKCMDKVLEVDGNTVTVEVVRGCGVYPSSNTHKAGTVFSISIDVYLSKAKLVPKVKAVLYE